MLQKQCKPYVFYGHPMSALICTCNSDTACLNWLVITFKIIIIDTVTIKSIAIHTVTNSSECGSQRDFSVI